MHDVPPFKHRFGSCLGIRRRKLAVTSTKVQFLFSINDILAAKKRASPRRDDVRKIHLVQCMPAEPSRVDLRQISLRQSKPPRVSPVTAHDSSANTLAATTTARGAMDFDLDQSLMIALCPELAGDAFLVRVWREKIAGRSMRHGGTSAASVSGGAASTSARDRDDELLKSMMVAAQGGDRVAYDALLRKCLPIVRRMARHHGAPEELIDDVVQDALLTMHRARHTYDAGRSFTVWMSMITHRRTVDALRQRHRRGGRETYAPSEYETYAEASDVAAEVKGDDEFAPVRQAIDALPEAQREAVERLALKEQTLQEASLETGRTTVALKVNLHRALKALRNRVAGGGHDA